LASDASGLGPGCVTSDPKPFDLAQERLVDGMADKRSVAGAPLLGKPRQCSIYKGPARRASKHATLQAHPLEIVDPCGSPASAHLNAT
jgi:hypothetical protein